MATRLMHISQAPVSTGSPYANAHHLVNRSARPATFIVAGARRPGNDTVHYPDDNLGPFQR